MRTCAASAFLKCHRHSATSTSLALPQKQGYGLPRVRVDGLARREHQLPDGVLALFAEVTEPHLGQRAHHAAQDLTAPPVLA